MDRTSKIRRALLDAAASVLAVNPGAPLSLIADEAGVGRATLYRHFSSRDELFRALALESLRAIDEATAGIEAKATSARHAIELVFEAVAPLGERYHFLLREEALESDPDFAREAARSANEMTELIEAAKSEGSIAAEVPTAWVLAAFDALIYAAWGSVRAGSVARNDAGCLAFRTLLDGLSRSDAAS